MEKNITVSIVIPIHDMQDGAGFFWRCINSIMKQTYKDYEIIITKEGRTSENTNAGIRKAKGDFIKFMHIDDFFSSEFALEEMVNNFTEDVGWLVTGCDNNPYPIWTDDIESGNNKIGSPSVVMIRNDNPPLFNENLVWLLDCDYYKKLYDKYGEPKILNSVNINIGVHAGQMTNLIAEDIKSNEIKKHV